MFSLYGSMYQAPSTSFCSSKEKNLKKSHDTSHDCASAILTQVWPTSSRTDRRRLRRSLKAWREPTSRSRSESALISCVAWDAKGELISGIHSAVQGQVDSAHYCTSFLLQSKYNRLDEIGSVTKDDVLGKMWPTVVLETSRAPSLA